MTTINQENQTFEMEENELCIQTIYNFCKEWLEIIIAFTMIIRQNWYDLYP